MITLTITIGLIKVAERAGFEPAIPVSQYDGLANRWFQPLTHLSEAEK